MISRGNDCPADHPERAFAPVSVFPPGGKPRQSNRSSTLNSWTARLFSMDSNVFPRLRLRACHHRPCRHRPCRRRRACHRRRPCRRRRACHRRRILRWGILPTIRAVESLPHHVTDYSPVVLRAVDSKASPPVPPACFPAHPVCSPDSSARVCSPAVQACCPGADRQAAADTADDHAAMAPPRSHTPANGGSSGRHSASRRSRPSSSQSSQAEACYSWCPPDQWNTDRWHRNSATGSSLPKRMPQSRGSTKSSWGTL